ncbi:MAG: putative Ig domain-containing protein [Nitrospirae bacterium]|nr:putative Ig domain-containing protein [Nitrospirota bacterium]
MGLYRLYIAAILSTLPAWGIGTALAASGEWTLTLTVSTPHSAAPGGSVATVLQAGIRNGATVGYDNTADTVSLLEFDDPVQAHFPHGAEMIDTDGDGKEDGWDCPDPEPGYTAYQCSLWRDFRPLDETVTWRLAVLSPVDGGTISMNWRVDGGPEDLSGISIALVEAGFGNPPLPPINPAEIDLKNFGNFQYTTDTRISGEGYDLRTFEIRMKTTGLFITPPTLTPATVNTPYETSLRLIGDNGMWSLSEGEFPPGLVLHSSTGVISGTPDREGDYRFTVRADAMETGGAAFREYQMTVHPSLTITTADLPGGRVYETYQAPLEVSGGVAPLSWTLVSGILPEGIVLGRETGELSGTLQVPGIFDFTVQVADRIGAKGSHSYRITVMEPNDSGAPSAIDDLRVLYADGTTAILTWTAPWDDSLTGTAAAYDLRYRGGCGGATELTSGWETASRATGEPRPQPGALQMYTLKGFPAGVPVCAAIQSMDASGHLSPLSNVVIFPESSAGGTAGSSLITMRYELRKGYNLISVPLTPVPDDLSAFGDDVGYPVSLWRWYSAYPGLTESRWYLESSASPGRGYFLYAPEEGITLDLQGMANTGAEQTVRLHEGWNMVGDPYEVEIFLKDLRVRRIDPSGKEEVRSFEAAARAGWVGNALYPFDGLSYGFLAVNEDPSPALEPWKGFWLSAKDDAAYELIFSRP